MRRRRGLFVEAAARPRGDYRAAFDDDGQTRRLMLAVMGVPALRAVACS
jgi:hypothetical protein